MMLAHLYAYFIMLSSVFRSRRDWMIFAHTTLVISLIVSYIALLQKLGLRLSLQGGFRVDSTIGNPAYLAAYLLFHIWIAALLLVNFWKKYWLAAIYALVVVFELSIVYFTATRGAILGLLGSIVIGLAVLTLFWSKIVPKFDKSWPKARVAVAGALVFLLILPVGFWAVRDREFIKSSPVLSRFASISLNDRTTQSRFAIWRMSLQGAAQRPILGWGQENYYLIFQKYYNPSLYGNEPWFDRSHNIIFDWLINAGVVGLTAYLAIFVVAGWTLLKSIAKKYFSPIDALLIGGMFSAYFLQNMFVFDNLNTYLLFFGALAYIDSRSKGVFGYQYTYSSASRQDRNFYSALAVCSVLLILFIGAFNFLHLRPIRESKAIIRALQAFQQRKPLVEIVDTFKEALSYNSFGDTEAREQLANVARSVLEENTYSEEDRKKIASFAIDEMRKETTGQAVDVKHLLFLGALLNRAAVFDEVYALEAEQVLRQAISLSPTKQVIYFELAQLYLSQNKINDALSVLVDAWNLDRSFRGAGANVWTIAVLAGDKEMIEEVKKEISIERLSEEMLIRIIRAYRQVGDFGEDLARLYSVLVKKAPKNADYRLEYAAALDILGKREEAVKQAKQALSLSPQIREKAKDFFEKLGL